MKIKIVADEACPKCGAVRGHEDKTLDFPNRPKVGDKNNVWWWRCYNPDCSVEYYEPHSGKVDEQSLTKDRAQELMRKIDSMPIPDIPDILD